MLLVLFDGFKKLIIYGAYTNMTRFTRICWNSNDWIEPSGVKGKGTDKEKLFEAREGFGHEEWLFDTDKLIEGYHYAHLQALNAAEEYLEGLGTFDIILFSRERLADNSIRLWEIGKISNISPVLPTESALKFNIYSDEGWIGEMGEQLEKLRITANAKILSKDPGKFFNVKFKPEDMQLVKQVVTDEPTIRTLTEYCWRYGLYHVNTTDNNVFNIYQQVDNDNWKGGVLRKRATEAKKSRVATPHDEQKTRPLVEMKMSQEMCAILVKAKFEVWEGRDTMIRKGVVDIAVRLNEKPGAEIYYELKTGKPSVKRSIRDALSQIMEYAFYPPNIQRARGLVIVSQWELDCNGKKYIDMLNKEFNLPIFYQQFVLGDKELRDAYPENPLEIACD
jgi:hypothetical protein